MLTVLICQLLALLLMSIPKGLSLNFTENCIIAAPDRGMPSFIFTPPSRFETFTVIELDPETGSKCLDSSNYKFLFSQGSGSGLEKFMFNFLGGAFCGIEGLDALESCFMRSKTPLGSSNFLGENGSQVSVNENLGYFSGIQEENPQFWNWNRVMIRYCDGSNHQGYAEDPYIFNGEEVWFRGYNNTISVFEYMKLHYKLFEAKEIIISGGSAGGQATFIWTSYLQDYFPETVKLMAIPDAGLFLDVYNQNSQCYLFRHLNTKIANLTNSAELSLFQRCRYKDGDDFWKCLLPEYILEDINVSVFIVNSQDDSEAMRTQYGVNCIKDPEQCTDEEKERIGAFRGKFLNIVRNIQEKKEKWGFWLRTCFEHVYQGSDAWYNENFNVFNERLERWYNLKFALNFWYNEGDIRNTSDSLFIDFQNWEENLYCTSSIRQRGLDDFYRALFFMGLGLLIYWFILSKLTDYLEKGHPTLEERELIES